MTEVLKLYKRLGETPLECIERFRIDSPLYKDANMTYAGRLDPMAEGLLLVLAGNTRDKEKYLNWDKTYEFEVLWGFTTDTYDVLGLSTRGKRPTKLEERMPRVIKDIQEKKTQSYPPYSSRTVGGLPLHAWARAGKISEIEIPERSIKIFSIEHQNTRMLKENEILKEIIEKINLVKGNFRQEETLKMWKELTLPEENVFISSFTIDVSSGTYIRSLANEMGEILGTGAIAYSIKRTRVGEYKLDN